MEPFDLRPLEAYTIYTIYYNSTKFQKNLPNVDPVSEGLM